MFASVVPWVTVNFEHFLVNYLPFYIQSIIICDITIFAHLLINLTNITLICSYNIKTDSRDDKNKLKLEQM